jgi:methyl-accepting chemotaxis protein
MRLSIPERFGVFPPRSFLIQLKKIMNSTSMKLSSRLFLAFGAVVLLCVLSSGAALFMLGRINDDLNSIVNDNNVKVSLNQQMADSIHVVTRVMRTIALLTDDAKKAEERQKIVAARAAYDQSRAALDKLPVNEAGKTRRAAIDEAAARSRPINDKVIQLGLSNQSGEATALLMNEAGPATQRWQDAVDANIAAQAENSQLEYASAQANYLTARNTLIGAALATVLIAVVLTQLVVRSIVRELGGEPGEVAGMVQSIADADLTRSIAVRTGDTTSVVAGMARMQAALADVVGSVRGNAESVATASTQIAQGNADLSQRTEEQASALQQTAATMEQLGTTVRNNAESARQANQLAAGASGVAAKGGAVVGQVVDTMRGINTSSKKIADIISVIDGIAFQTNILALNAAVEAARAGEQGRGFAVVASEVRNLAQRSADAAKQIKTLINHSVEQVELGTTLVDQAGKTMEEIVGAIQRVTDIVAEISAASVEQSSGVSQVGQAISQMDQVTQQNAALVEESAAAAESLKQQAQALVQTVAVFRLNHDTTRPLPLSSPMAPSRPQPAAPLRSPPRVTAKAPAAEPAAQPTSGNDWESF